MTDRKFPPLTCEQANDARKCDVACDYLEATVTANGILVVCTRTRPHKQMRFWNTAQKLLDVSR